MTLPKLLTIITVLFAFNAKAQIDTTLKCGDTIPKVALITNADDNLAGEVNIYECRCKVLLNGKTKNIWFVNVQIDDKIIYFTEDKQPIPSHWVIWQVK